MMCYYNSYRNKLESHMADLNFDIELDDEETELLESEVLVALEARRKAQRHLRSTMRPSFRQEGGRAIMLDPTPLPAGSHEYH